MSRPLRLDYPGGVFHITCRGNERRPTFLDDGDREHFLHLLGKTVARFEWVLTAYVLMTNHFHLVLELTAGNLSRGMHWLNTTYAANFNRRHARVGHLHQGRFKAFLIDKENYMLEVLRYVVLNPVRGMMVSRPEDYRWSSYRATAGMIAAPEWLAVDDVLVAFGEGRSLAQARYRRFVADGIGNERVPWHDLTGQVYLGSERWLDEVRDRVQTKPRPDEHPRSQREVHSPSMARVIMSVAHALQVDAAAIRLQRGGTPRMVAAWLGRHEANLTLSEIAAGLRVRSTGHVSALIHRCDDAITRDEVLRASLDRCIGALHQLWKSDEAKV